MGIGAATLEGVEGADLNGVTGEGIGTLLIGSRMIGTVIEIEENGVGKGKRTEGRRGGGSTSGVDGVVARET